MRPRHKAAENDAEPLHEELDVRASMRPRHKAAENISPARARVGACSVASMRPRHKAAENATSIDFTVDGTSTLQ